MARHASLKVESAFIVQAPEVEPYVAQLRAQFDPSARLGVPAHVTVLYPFMPPECIGEDVLHRVRAFFSTFPAFKFVLAEVSRFPGTVYLAPEPASRFVDFTTGLSRLFPDYQPYGGRHERVIPHLTAARAGESELGSIELQLRAALPTQGVSARCNEVVLIENSSGRWRPFDSFRLAALPTAAGYSGTPLAAKLGIKPGTRLRVINAPEGYRELVAPLPEGTLFVSKLSSSTDIVHVFSTRKSELLSRLRTCRERLRPTAAVWVSWPKKSARLATDITEDTIREIALPLGFVDIKVCAICEIWSGLKLVVRKELR